jgi:hypothetical protein
MGFFSAIDTPFFLKQVRQKEALLRAAGQRRDLALSYHKPRIRLGNRGKHHHRLIQYSISRKKLQILIWSKAVCFVQNLWKSL